MNTYDMSIERVEACIDGEYISPSCIENIRELCCGRSKRERDWYGTIRSKNRLGREILLTLEILRAISKVYRVEISARLEHEGFTLGSYDIHGWGWHYQPHR